MNPILALAVEPIAKVLAKAAAKLALKLHKGAFHETAERYRAEIEAAKKTATVILLFLVLATSGCMAYKRAFVAIHDSIDEALKDKTEQKASEK
jgi:hypothetical protein